MDRQEKKIRKQKEKERKRIREIRRDQPEHKLRLFWHKQANKLDSKDLIYVVSKIGYLPLKKRALRKFLGIDNLNFDDFYKMLDEAKNILNQDKILQSEFFKQCFDICNADNLVELIEAGVTEAEKELDRRIEHNLISTRKAIQVLIRVFEKTTNEKKCIALWKRIRGLIPNKKDLFYILRFAYERKILEITSDIERLLRKKENKTNKILRKIEELIAQIKQRQG